MRQRLMAPTVKDALLSIEKELSKRISAIQMQLAPLEKELADARRALQALSKAEEAVAPPPQAEHPASGSETQKPSSPYERLTMKELVMKALHEQFPHGADAQALLGFFAHAWGRNDIIRSSLSPQLTRLKREGKIRLDRRKWFLVQSVDKEKAPTGEAPEGAFEAGQESGSRPQSSLLD